MSEVRTYCEDDRGCVRCTAVNAQAAADYLWRALEAGVDTEEGRRLLDLGMYVSRKVAVLSEGILQD